MGQSVNVNLQVTADASQAKAQLKQLQTSLERLTNNSANLHLGLNANELQQASMAVKDLSVHLKEAVNVRTGTLDFTKLSMSIKSSGSTLQEYGNQLLKLGPQGQQAFNQLAQAIAKSEVPMRRFSGLFGEFGKTLINTARWQISSSIIHNIMGSIQHAYSYAQNLNESLNKIQIVTQQSNDQMARFAESANKAAKALSTTTTTYTDAALIYYQQGLSSKEVEERTNVTIKMANAAGVSAKIVSDQMTAVWNNFADGSKSLEYYADVMTALGAATASSTDEIATGLEKFAAVADTVGLSYENAAAALATITATTRQSADTVGTGLRTLFARLESIKLGETLEDGVGLTKYSQALATAGVSVLNTNGELRTMDEILEDLGKRWQSLSDTQKTALAQTVGGVRQYTNLIALMDNFDFYKQNQQVALTSEGTVQKQADIYAQSWEASQKRVKASAEAIYKDLINDKFFITLNNGFATVLDGVDALIDGLGGLKTILPGIISLMLQAFGPQINAGMVNFATSISQAFANPATLRQKRDEFLSTAARQSVGIFNDNRQLTQEEQYRVGLAQRNIELQQIYGRNESVMDEHQKTIAKNYLDRYNNLTQQYDAQRIVTNRAQANIANQGDATVQFNAGLGNRLGQIQRIMAAFNQWKAAGSKITNSDADLAAMLTNPEDLAFYKSLIGKNNVALRAKMGLTGGQINPTATKFDQKTFLDNFNKDVTESLKQPAEAIEKLRAETQNWEGDVEKLKAKLKELKISDEEITKAGLDSLGENATPEDIQDSVDTIIAGREADYQKNIEDFASEWGFTVEQVQNYSGALIEAAGSQEKLAALARQIKADEEAATAAVNKRSKAMETAQKITGTAQALMSLSSAASSASTFTNGLIDVIQGKGQVSIGTFTTGLMNLSSTVLMVAQGMKVLNTTFTALEGTPWGAIIAVAAAVIPAIITGINKAIETDAEKLERLTQEADEAREAANESSQAYQNLLSQRSQHNDLLDTLNELTQGTLEFRDALIQANQLADEIIKTNGLKYGTDWFINDKGAKIITEEAYKKISERDLKKAESDSLISSFAAARKSEQEIQQKYAENIENYQNNELIGTVNGQNTVLRNIISKEWDIQNSNNNEATNFAVQNPGFDNWYEILQSYADWLDQAEDKTIGFTEFFEKIVNGSNLNDFETELGKKLEKYDGIIPNLEKYLSQNGYEDLTTLGQSLYQERISTGYTNQYNAGGFYEENKELTGLLTSIASRNGNEPDIIDDFIVKQISERYTTAGKTLDTLYQESLDEINAALENSENEEQTLKERYLNKTGLELENNDYFSEYYDKGKLNIDKVKTELASYEAYDKIVKEFETQRGQIANDAIKSYGSLRKMNVKQLTTMLAEMKANRSLGDYYDDFQQYVIDEAQRVQNAYAEAQAKYLTMDQITNNPVDTKEIKLEDLSAITEFTNQFGEKYGTKVGAAINIALTDSIKNNDGLLNALRDVDFAETILGTMSNIKQVSRTLGETAQKEVANILQSFRDEYGNLGLFEELFNSETFADSLKSLQKVYKKTGKIGADALLDVAEESEELAMLLESNEINAVALSDALELIEAPENGINGVEDLSESLIKALTLAGDLENILAGVYSYIDNFQEARSITDIGKFYQGLAKGAVDSFEKGFVVDDNLLQSFEEFFGDEFVSKYYDFMASLTGDENLSPEQISKQAYENFKAQFDAINKVVEDGNLSGLWDYYSSQGKIDLLGSLNENGQFELADMDAIKTILGDKFTASDFVNYLEKQGVPEHLAEAMVTEYSRTNVALGQHFRGQSAIVGLGALFEGDALSISNLEAYINKYKDVLKNMDLEDFKEIFNMDDSTFDTFLLETNANLEEFADGILTAEELLSLLTHGAKLAGKELINMGDGFKANLASLKELNEAYNANHNGKDFVDYLFGEKDKGGRRKGLDYEQDDTGAVQETMDLATAQKKLAAAGVTSEASQFAAMQQMINEGIDGIQLEGFTAQIRDANGELQTLTMTSEEFGKWCKKNELEGTVEDFANWTEELQNNEDLTKTINQQASVMAEALVQAFSKGGPNGEPLDLKVNLKLADGVTANISGQINDLKVSLLGENGEANPWTTDFQLNFTDSNGAAAAVKDLLGNIQTIQNDLAEHSGLTIEINQTGNGSLMTGVVIAAVGAALQTIPEDATKISIEIAIPESIKDDTKDINDIAQAEKNLTNKDSKIKLTTELPSDLSTEAEDIAAMAEAEKGLTNKEIFISVKYKKKNPETNEEEEVGEGFNAIITVETDSTSLANTESEINKVAKDRPTKINVTATTAEAAAAISGFLARKHPDATIGLTVPEEKVTECEKLIEKLTKSQSKNINPKVNALDKESKDLLATITADQFLNIYPIFHNNPKENGEEEPPVDEDNKEESLIIPTNNRVYKGTSQKASHVKEVTQSTNIQTSLEALQQPILPNEINDTGARPTAIGANGYTEERLEQLRLRKALLEGKASFKEPDNDTVLKHSGFLGVTMSDYTKVDTGEKEEKTELPVIYTPDTSEVDKANKEIEEGKELPVTLVINSGGKNEHSLEFGSEEEVLNKFQEDYQKFLQAKIDLENGKNSGIDTTGYQDIINSILAEWGVKEPQFIEAGKMVNAGLGEGLSDNKDEVTSAGEMTATELLDQLKATLGIASPSTETQEMGKFLDEGLKAGIEEGTGEVLAAATQLATQIIETIQNYLNEHPLKIQFQFGNGSSSEEGEGAGSIEMPEMEESSDSGALTSAIEGAKSALAEVSQLTSQINTQITKLGNNPAFHKFVEEAGAAGSQLMTAKDALDKMASKITELGNSAESLDMQPFTSPILEASQTLQSFIDLIKKPEVKEGEEEQEVSEAQTVTLNVTDNGTIEGIQGRIEALSQISPEIIVTANTDQARDAIMALDGITISVNAVANISGLPPVASGLNNGNGHFAGGKHVRNDYWGLAEVGELGPELMIHRGMPYLAGVDGRTKAYVEPGDQIFTAAETQKILESNPTLQDIPGFSVGYGSGWKFGGSKGGYGGGGSREKNRKTKDFDPERYHLITRQLADINREYDRLNKIKDKAFGKNKLDAIQKEIKATNELIEAQKTLIKEVEEYREKDLKRLTDELGIEIELDVNGNLANFEDLQEKYGRLATEAEDDETKEWAQERWKAIQQYEETIDKWNEAQTQLQDYIFQLQEESLELITTKVEQKIEFDEKQLDIIEHFLKKTDDDAYATADALQLVGGEINTIVHQINSAYEGIEDIMKNLYDQEGNKIEGMSLAEFLSLTDEERNNLHANSESMEAMIDLMEQILDYTEKLEDLKTFGAERLSKVFDKLNDNLTNEIDLYDHYKSLAETIKDIADLQGNGLTPQSNALLTHINEILMKNSENNLKSQQDYYKTLQATKEEYKKLRDASTDKTVQKAYDELIDGIDSKLRDVEENMLSYWQELLQFAQDEFNRQIDIAVDTYNKSLSGIYGTLDELSSAYDRKKEINEQYLEDYEKYYKLSKLERDLTKTIDNLTVNGSKQQKNLVALLSQINDFQKNGTKLSEYDMEVLQKKYEIEKARAELEEAREAKQTVRLQRNRDGSWGYVYTLDEDNIAELEQRYEDAVYNYQNFNNEQLDEMSRQRIQLWEEYANEMKEINNDMTKTKDEQEQLRAELLEDYLKRDEFFYEELNKILQNQSETVSRAYDIYKDKIPETGDIFTDLIDTYEETYLYSLTNLKNSREESMKSMKELYEASEKALEEYYNTVDYYDKRMGSSIETFLEDTTILIDAIGTSSEETTNKVNLLGEELVTTFIDATQAAKTFEEKTVPYIQSLIEPMEILIVKLTEKIGLMNEANELAKEYEETMNRITIAESTGPSYEDFYLNQFDKEWAQERWKAIQQYDETINKLKNLEDNTTLMAQWLNMIDSQSNSMSQGLSVLSSFPDYINDKERVFEQNVTINAEFPNAIYADEIEMVFTNLANKATQYANTQIKYANT